MSQLHLKVFLKFVAPFWSLVCTRLRFSKSWRHRATRVQSGCKGLKFPFCTFLWINMTLSFNIFVSCVNVFLQFQSLTYSLCLDDVDSWVYVDFFLVSIFVIFDSVLPQVFKFVDLFSEFYQLRKLPIHVWAVGSCRIFESTSTFVSSRQNWLCTLR